MRRLTSILTSLAVAAGAVSISSSVAMAAGGTLTKKTSATVAPSTVPNATILRFARLSKSNSFLVVGYDSQAVGAQMKLWKINDDLSIDTAFGAADLGSSTALPTSTNSMCVRNNTGSCWYLNSLDVNEAADRYIVSMGRQLDGTGSSSGQNTTLTTTLLGKVSTGEVLATSVDIPGSNSYFQGSGWASYGATEFSKQLCTSLWGGTYQSIALEYARLEMYSTFIRPDGSIVPMITCQYSNQTGSNSQTNVREYETRGLVGLKVSNSSLVLDTSWGTNGLVKLFDDPTKCSNSFFPPSAANRAITSVTSTDLYATIQTMSGPRVTTWPYPGSNDPLSYDGCANNYNPNNVTDSKLLALDVKGTIKTTNTLVNGSNMYISRWVIDPSGKWNSIVNVMSGATPSRKLIRLNSKGELDTTLGADGTKELTGLPTSLTVNGSSVPISYTLSGIAVTPSGFYFTGFSTTGFSSCNGQNYTSKQYPYYFSADTGLLSTYGTNGLGEEFSLELTTSTNCQSSARLSFINSKGQHASIAQVSASGSQAAGLISAVWDAADGVTSGGESAGTETSGGSTGRVDKKVYSIRLPKTAQTGSALTVLTRKQAASLDIRTSTPKICVALTTSVLLVNPGRCVVRIVNADQNKIVRTMSTLVKKSDVATGTIVTTEKPIYFKQAKTKLSKTTRAQVAALVETAKNSARIVVVGHSAALGEVSRYSYAISRNRANAVKAALIKAGVKVPIEVIALAYNQPAKTAKTEKAQALNRRAEVFIFPK